MQTLILSLWASQGIVMMVDEFKYHRQRRLGLWERVGHPIDTFFFLLPFLYVQVYTNDALFWAMCVFSSLIITKDEFIHSKECEGAEQWLHSMLFILHPLALVGLWFAWKNEYKQIILLQSVIILLFMIYQIIYWNLINRRRSHEI
jgi:hypothetical protein